MDSTADDRAEAPPQDKADAGRVAVQQRLEQRYPELDPLVVAEVVAEAYEATSGARIDLYRPLLVEHRAGDRLRAGRLSHP